MIFWLLFGLLVGAGLKTLTGSWIVGIVGVCVILALGSLCMAAGQADDDAERGL